MLQLTLEEIDDATIQALTRRAARHGRTLEAEAREVLRQALLREKPTLSFKEYLATMPDVGEDADFIVARGPHREIDL